MSQTPHHSAEAEKAILGAMFQSQSSAAKIFGQTAVEDYYMPGHKVIFSTSNKLFLEGRPFDEVALIAELEKSGELARAGGIGYITDLQGELPALTNLGHYLKLLKENRQRRDLVAALHKIHKEAYGINENEYLMSLALDLIHEISEIGHSGEVVSMDKAATDAYFEIERRSKNKGAPIGVPTGFFELDDVIGGMRRGNLIVLGARPSVGKSALAVNIAVNAAKKGYRSLVFSLEMPVLDLATRIMCGEKMLPIHRVMNGDLKSGGISDEWEKLAQAMGEVGKLPISIVDQMGIGLSEIRAIAQRQKSSSGLDLIVLDYLQLVQRNGNKGKTTNDEISAISRALKCIAKDLEVPVLMLSQLSRKVEERSDQTPMLSDLRDSGSIEQDADVVLLMTRDKQDDNKPTELIVAKNRNGPLNTVELCYLSNFCLFRSWNL